MSASFEKLIDDNLSTVTMKTGSLVTGIVIDILESHVIVHVGLKSEAAVQIQEFYNETGCPMVVNTSLNIKGEPLVNTVEHAKEFEQKHNIKVYS